MSSLKKLGFVSAMLLCGLSAAWASSDRPDVWITTKARIAILSADGAGRTAVKVETSHGRVTLHGKVATEAEKSKAEATVRAVDGVKSINNLVQVVPQADKEAVKVSDADVKTRVEAAFGTHKTLEGVKVASVDAGVVRLDGKTRTLASKLQAIEVAYACDGVRQVATEIETTED
jgi:hyperosmotically inducible protein